MSSNTALQYTRIGSLRLIMSLLLSLTSVVAFIRVGIFSDYFHSILPLFRYFPQGLFLMALMTFCFLWLAEARKWPLNFCFFGRDMSKGGPFIGLTCALLASILVVFIAWSGTVSDYHFIGGMIPWSDASGYYYGAEHLLQNGLLDSWNQRRPLNAVLFSVRLGLTGGHFQYALILQACMLAGSIFLASRVLVPRLGRTGAFMMFAILLGYSALYLPTTLSETLGITLGALAFALLWYGVERKSVSVYLVGLCALTLALLARPGAMLILVLLTLYAGRFFRKASQGYSWKAMFLAVMAVGGGGLVNGALSAIYGDGSGFAQGNFSFVLYGLAAGGKGWSQIYRDFPQIGTLVEADAARFAYQKAFAQIVANPLLIMKVYVYGLLAYPLSFLQQLFGVLVAGDEHLPMRKEVTLVIGVVLVFGAVRITKKSEFRPMNHFLLVSLAGIILSLPIVYADGGIRMIASVMPFVAGVIVTAIIGLGGGEAAVNQISGDDSSLFLFTRATIPSALLGLLVFFALMGPLFFRKTINPSRFQLGSYCTGDEQEVVMRIGPGTPYINLVSDSKRHSFVPNIRIQDFVIPDGNEIATGWRAIQSPATIVSGYDMVSQRQKYLVAPAGFVGTKTEIKTVCAVPFNSYIWLVRVNETRDQRLND